MHLVGSGLALAKRGGGALLNTSVLGLFLANRSLEGLQICMEFPSPPRRRLLQQW